MEILLIIGAVVFYALSLKKKVRRVRRAFVPYRGRKVAPKTRPVQRSRSQNKRRSLPSPPRPFEHKTATPLTTREEISGPAYVIDGDSIVIRKTQVRLFGVDAPEMNHPYGKKAKWALVSLCKGQTVRAVISEKDAYGRTVARCYLPDGRDLSAEMVKLGLAIDWPKFSRGIYRAMEVPDARKKMWLADARQKGRMHVWEQFDYNEMRKKKAG